MPVIGRLDKQVEDVLITPIGKNSSREDAGAGDDGQARSDGAREPDSSATREREPAARGRDEDAHEDRQSHPTRRAGDDEPLPVWLL
ncbi:MAG: hypothetical protein LC746_10105 [Acidobacteria bacterium]|nr:hypothetical protein [Acidobacteriota bacterium]